MTTKAQREAIAKYDRNNTVRYTLKLNKKTDDDIIDFLGMSDNKQGIIKHCIRYCITKLIKQEGN